MRIRGALVALCLCLVYVAAVPKVSQRIVGGSLATISQYPALAALLYSNDLNIYIQACGGAILNTRSILTVANCPYGDTANRWRIRVGSSYANSGGIVHAVGSFVIHSDYDTWTQDSDIAIIRSATSINYVNNAVQPGTIAGPNYIPADNQVVWTAGWGVSSVGGSFSEQLRHVQVYTINQVTCRSRYTALGWPVTDNMLCSGYPTVGGRDQCEGDYGSPLYHSGVIVGVYSWGYQCAMPDFPSVSTRISRFSLWIQNNA